MAKLKKILDVGFGRKTLFELFRSAKISSRLQYGLAQLEDKYEIVHVSWKQFSFWGILYNNLRVLKRCDVVFLSYLYLKPIFLLIVFRRLGFCRNKRLIVVSHISLYPGKNRIEYKLLSFLYKGIDKVLFHSPKNLEESVERGLVSYDRCDFLSWGDDLEYIDSTFKPSCGSFFLSTGRENRDYQMVISAFSKIPCANLEIYTNQINYDNNYTYLVSEINKYKNVRIEFVKKTVETTNMLASKVSDCMCVVIPLLPNNIYYCLGLTSIVEAMAMGKPIISTYNPYYPLDLEKEGVGIYVDSEDAWVDAIRYLSSHPDIVQEMGKRARALAEKRFNIIESAKQLEALIDSYP